MAIYLGTTLLRGGCGEGGGGGGSDPGWPAASLAALWLATSLGLDDGDPVTAWAPSYGSPGTLINPGPSAPAFLATGSPVGGPCVSCNGTTQYLYLDNPAGLPVSDDPGTIVAIVSRVPAQPPSYRHVVQLGTRRHRKARGIGYNESLWVTVDWGSNLAGESTSPRTTAPAVLGHTYDGTTLGLWLNGSPIATSAVGLSTGSDRLTVGRELSGAYGGEFGTFRIMELAFYTSVLSNAEWAQVMNHARFAQGLS